MRFLPAVILVACTSPSITNHGPVARFDPDSSDTFAVPFPNMPSLESSSLDWTARFPNPNDNSLIHKFILGANDMEGYSTTAAVYLRFSESFDVESLPSGQESITSSSPIFLVNIDPNSPFRGERVPLQFEYNEMAGTYLPEHTLAAAPIWGFPLRPTTAYALVVTTEIASPDSAFTELWTAHRHENTAYSSLAETLLLFGISTDDVAMATTYRTSDPLQDMSQLVKFVHENIELPTLTQSVVRLAEHPFFQTFGGEYLSPLFQHGEKPYRTEGGGFRFREDGLPEIAAWETMRLAVCTPLDISSPPPGGWPVVIQQHGTGGDYLSHCSENSIMEVASQLSPAGFISLGIDQPLHGTRSTPDTNFDMDTFNYLNPESAAAIQRQGAIDAIYLARGLAEQTVQFTTPEGDLIPLDHQRIYFLGHSQGGTTGALAVPWMGRDISAAVLSGAGGGLALTMVDRKEPLDIAQMIEVITGFAEEEHLTPLHPLAGLVQQLIDETDPINYAPYWFAETLDDDYYHPSSVLLFNGIYDEQTPHRTAEALTVAAHMPPLIPQITTSEALDLRGLSAIQAPISLNTQDANGNPVSAAFSQWAEGDHYVIFTEPDAADLYREFLVSAATGVPTFTNISE